MSNKYTITCDLFTLPYNGDDSILYAPRVGFACAVNKDLLNLISDLDSIDVGQLNQEQRAALDYLDQKGVLNGSREAVLTRTFPEKYSPTQLTLFPTNQCNLRCTYCYASAGDFKPMVMDWHFATSAVEQLIQNLKKVGMNQLSLGFHGGGEPLFPWELIKRIVLYTKERCANEGLNPQIFSATNGVLSERQLEWAVQHFKNLNISFDGLPDVQNYHRPLPNGKGSFEYVDRTMRYLDEHNFSYGIRGTISTYNIDRMEETVEFVGQNYKTKSLHLEPLFYCGRCKTSGTMSPEMQKFSDNFRQCEIIAEKYGLNLTYSGCNIDNLRNSFCGVSCDNFSVTPDGYITTCFEVTTKDDPKSDVFFIGRILEDGSLEIDEKKRQYLHSLTVDKLDFCQDCFAKWHCAGDCAAKIDHGDYTGPRGHERCQLNRELIANRLVRLVDGTYKSANAKFIKITKDDSNQSK